MITNTLNPSEHWRLTEDELWTVNLAYKYLGYRRQAGILTDGLTGINSGTRAVFLDDYSEGQKNDNEREVRWIYQDEDHDFPARPEPDPQEIKQVFSYAQNQCLETQNPDIHKKIGKIILCKPLGTCTHVTTDPNLSLFDLRDHLDYYVYFIDREALG
jgi:hypothetical protein